MQLFSFCILFSSVQLLSSVLLFATPWTAAHQASLSITNSWSLLKLMSIEFDTIQPSHLLLLLIFPSISVSSNESVLRITWPKYWSFSFSISASNEYSGWTSFRMGWFHTVAVQEALEFSQTPESKSNRSSVLSFLCSQVFYTFLHYRNVIPFPYAFHCFCF